MPINYHTKRMSDILYTCTHTHTHTNLLVPHLVQSEFVIVSFAIESIQNVTECIALTTLNCLPAPAPMWFFIMPTWNSLFCYQLNQLNRKKKTTRRYFEISQWRSKFHHTVSLSLRMKSTTIVVYGTQKK